MVVDLLALPMIYSYVTILNNMQRTQEWLKNGWFLVKSDFKKFVLITLFIYIILIITIKIPFISLSPSLYTIFISLVALSITPMVWPISVLTFILSPIISCGYFYVVFKKMNGQEVEFKDLLEGLKFFIPAFLANAIIIVLTIIGLILLIIPGIIISSLFMFTLPLIVEKKMGFWQAMEESRKVVQKDLPNFVIFLIILMGINFLGVMCLGVGLLVSTPFIISSIVCAYKELF